MQKYMLLHPARLFRWLLWRISRISILMGPLTLVRLRGNRYLRFPITIHRINIEITSVCNMHCKHCPIGLGVRPGEHMKIDVFRRSINEIISCIDSNLHFSELHLYSGGEPLLHPRLPEIMSILAKAKKNKRFPRTVIYTNCTMLSPALTRELVLSGGLDEIVFSIDMGRKEEYEALRVGGEFEAVLENAMEAVRVIREMNAPVKTRLVSIFPLTAGDRSLLSSIAHEFNLAEGEGNLHPRFLELAGMVDEFNPRPLHNWTGDRDLGLKRGEYYSSSSKGICAFIRRNIVILSDGSITPCCADLAGKGAYSHIMQSTLRAAIVRSSHRERMLRLMTLNRRREIPLCRHCEV